MKKSFKIVQILFTLLLVAVVGSMAVDVVSAMPDLSVQSFVDSLQYAIPHTPGISIAYVLASVPKVGANPGRPKGKNSQIIIFKWDDVSTNPARDEGGIKIEENLTLSVGKSAIAIYATPSSIKVTQSQEGDDDARGFIQQLAFDSPGDSLILEEFLENNPNENLGAIVRYANADYSKLLGTMYEPLQFEAEGQDDNEALKTTVTLKSVMRGPRIAHYYGDIPTLDTDGSGSGSGA